VHAALMPIARSTVSDALQGLSEAEQETLLALLETVKSHLGAMVEAGGQFNGEGFDADNEAAEAGAMGEATL
jgi:hypothetical protein